MQILELNLRRAKLEQWNLENPDMPKTIQYIDHIPTLVFLGGRHPTVVQSTSTEPPSVLVPIPPQQNQQDSEAAAEPSANTPMHVDSQM